MCESNYHSFIAATHHVVPLALDVFLADILATSTSVGIFTVATQTIADTCIQKQILLEVALVVCAEAQ